jgi:hypothetical protein
MRLDDNKYVGLAKRIAKWKSINFLEQWLGEKADFSEFCKSIYVWYYKMIDYKYYKCGKKKIETLLQDSKKYRDIPKNWLIKDMVYSLHRFGASYEDYLLYDFASKNAYGRASFVSDKLRHYYSELCNGVEVPHLMNDKYATYQVYMEFYKRSCIGIYSEKDKEKFEEFIKRSKKIVIKPMSSNCGHGVEVVNIDKIKVDQFFLEQIQKGAFICEEIVKQSNELALLNFSSINTLRVVTFVLRGEVYILAACLRMGRAGKFVDNAGAGGIFANVDVKDGIVSTRGRSYNGDYYNFHPDSGVQIVGFKIPDYDKVISMIHSIAKYRQDTILIAWDLAHTDEGWIMIEGNAVGSWDIFQVHNATGYKKDLFCLMDSYFDQNSYGNKK